MATDITGTVRLASAKPEEFSRVVVYVTGFDQAASPGSKLVIQKNLKFEPTVIPITRGESVTFSNLDSEVHNVFSASITREFDLGEQDSGGKHTIQFTKTGLVNVFCNIHPEMALSILVLPNRAFSKVDSNGRFKISGALPGSRKIVAWHPLATPIIKQVDVGDKAASVEFDLVLTKKVVEHLNKYGRPYKLRKYQ